MSRLLFCWEPYLRLIASLKFSAADEGLQNAFSAGFASLVTNDDLDVSLFKKIECIFWCVRKVSWSFPCEPVLRSGLCIFFCLTVELKCHWVGRLCFGAPWGTWNFGVCPACFSWCHPKHFGLSGLRQYIQRFPHLSKEVKNTTVNRHRAFIFTLFLI